MKNFLVKACLFLLGVLALIYFLLSVDRIPIQEEEKLYQALRRDRKSEEVLIRDLFDGNFEKVCLVLPYNFQWLKEVLGKEYNLPGTKFDNSTMVILGEDSAGALLLHWPDLTYGKVLTNKCMSYDNAKLAFLNSGEMRSIRGSEYNCPTQYDSCVILSE